MKIRPVEAELFHADRLADGQTDRHDEANSRFSQFRETRLKIVQYNATVGQKEVHNAKHLFSILIRKMNILIVL